MGEKLEKTPPKCKNPRFSWIPGKVGRGNTQFSSSLPGLSVAAGSDSCKSPGRAMDLHSQAHFHEINVTIKNGDLGRRRKTYGAVPSGIINVPLPSWSP